MKLFATITSERGKPAIKSGNDYLQINLQDENRVIFGSVYILPNNRVYGSIHGNKFDYREVKAHYGIVIENTI